MEIKRLNIIILLGLIATIGILIAQLLWTNQAYNLEEKKFTQKVQIALLDVAKSIYEYNNLDFPNENPIKKISNDYYVVNVNSDLSPDVLELYLYKEFNKSNLVTDYEYAIYDCSNEEMLYGKYISIHENAKQKASFKFPTHQNLEYYFAIRFPKEQSYLFGSLRFWLLLTFALIMILLVYVYSIYSIFQYKKLAELQRDFINNMTHEFKTPLSSILLASNSMSENTIIQQDEKLTKYNEIITNQSHILNRHIEKILNVAKSDATILSIQPVEIELRDFIEGISDSIKEKHKNLEIILNIPTEHTIQADAFHFHNVVTNLLDNSVKYCPENPSVTISSIIEKKKFILTFTDNSIGVENKNVSVIFDKFFRENQEKTQVKGFGLGLYYVKKIVQLHKWKIKAENNENEGITITFLIPLNKKLKDA